MNSPDPVQPVLIAGAGPVGKVLALELARFGVDSVLVDPGNGITPGARARLTNARSMELLRRLQLADRVRELAPLPQDYPVRSVYLAQFFAGRVIAEFRGAYASTPDDRFPEPSQYLPQDRLEQAMLERVQREPAITLALGERVTDFTVEPDHVRVSLDTGRVLGARYLIGCDGGASVVRRRLGIELLGEWGIMSSVTVELRSRQLREIIERAGIGLATQHWVLNPDAPVLMSAMDGHDRWTMLYMHDGQGLDAGDPVQLFRTAVGTPDVDVEILEVTPWSGHKLLAEGYGGGRVLIAGDAAHMHPPTGGYGMNTGIGDAVNLGWKLAAIEAGWGHPRLLETYETERRPVHERVIAEAVDTGSVLPEHLVTDSHLNDDTPEAAELRRRLGDEILRVKARQHKATGVILGDRYDDSPIVVPDGSPAEPPQTTDFVPSARPGARLPHVWLGDGESLYDRLGPWHTLIDLSGRSRPSGAVATSVPVSHLPLENPSLRALCAADYVLVRPDLHVAWRGNELPDPDVLGRRICGFELAEHLDAVA